MSNPQGHQERVPAITIGAVDTSPHEHFQLFLIVEIDGAPKFYASTQAQIHRQILSEFNIDPSAKVYGGGGLDFDGQTLVLYSGSDEFGSVSDKKLVYQLQPQLERLFGVERMIIQDSASPAGGRNF